MKKKIHKILGVTLAAILLMSLMIGIASLPAAADPGRPNQPINISPADGDTGVTIIPTIQSSLFSDPDGDLHRASQWQITTTSGKYSHPVFDATRYVANLTSISIPLGTLDYDSTYYWRVRHQDMQNKWSRWSTETSFTTQQSLFEGAIQLGPVAVAPDPSSIFVAVEYEAPIPGGNGTGQWAVIKSDDMASSWVPTCLINNTGPITDIAVSPNYAIDERLYVAAYNNSGPAVFRLTDSGENLPDYQPPPIDGVSEIYSLDVGYIDDEAYVFVGTDLGVFVINADLFGATWIHVLSL